LCVDTTKVEHRKIELRQQWAPRNRLLAPRRDKISTMAKIIKFMTIFEQKADNFLLLSQNIFCLWNERYVQLAPTKSQVPWTTAVAETIVQCGKNLLSTSIPEWELHNTFQIKRTEASCLCWMRTCFQGEWIRNGLVEGPRAISNGCPTVVRWTDGKQKPTKPNPNEN